MTIGIAAHGPNAGLAIIRALAAVESVGRGAIGGFVSFVAIGENGRLHRAETQTGGTAGLFPRGIGSMPPDLAQANIAGLMSSGPNRPEPLSQFTPADPSVGLVTGHRMPNTRGVSGRLVNEEALRLLADGLSAQEVADLLTGQNPALDIGIIALTVKGGIGLANTAAVARRPDAGQALVERVGENARAAVIHNAILPSKPVAQLAAEVAIDVMFPADRSDGHIQIESGVPFCHGPRNALLLDEGNRVIRIVIRDSLYMSGRWNFGIGYLVDVKKAGAVYARLVYEPFMVVEDGTLKSIDGEMRAALPVKLMEQ